MSWPIRWIVWRSGPKILTARVVRTPVESMSVRFLIGIVHVLTAPVRRSRWSISATRRSWVIPPRHSDSGFRFVDARRARERRERSFGGRYLDIRPDADALARYGLTTGDAQEVISLALGGEEITTTVEGRERYPVQVRYARDFRDDPTTISRLLVGGRDGPQVPLGQVADIQFSPGPPMIRSEGGYLYDQVSIDVRGRDVGSYVRDAQGVVTREVKLPTGYWLRWSGQYEALQRVKARLQVVIPLTLGIIALLLYLTFGTVAETAIVMVSLPFALVGGVWIMWLLDYNLSIAVAVGFIALAGVAAETGVVMLIYLDHAWQDATKARPRPTLAELVGAIEHGAVNRVRPKLMTVLAIMLGLVPALWSHGTGASVMKRIAAPMVGGMVTSTILTLIVIPVIYYLWRRRGLKGSDEAVLRGATGERT